MSLDELIDALNSFTERTGVEWESMFGESEMRLPDEFCVVFKLNEESEDE